MVVKNRGIYGFLAPSWVLITLPHRNAINGSSTNSGNPLRATLSSWDKLTPIPSALDILGATPAVCGTRLSRGRSRKGAWATLRRKVRPRAVSPFSKSRSRHRMTG